MATPECIRTAQRPARVDMPFRPPQQPRPPAGIATAPSAKGHTGTRAERHEQDVLARNPCSRSRDQASEEPGWGERFPKPAHILLNRVRSLRKNERAKRRLKSGHGPDSHSRGNAPIMAQRRRCCPSWYH